MKTSTKIKIEKRLALIRSMPKPASPSERLNLSIKDVVATGFVKVDGVTYYVDEMHRYQQKSDKWFELKLISLLTGEVCYLEWEQDDELEITLSFEVLKLRDLGISSSKLIEIDDEEEGNFIYSGKTFYYEDSNEARFFKNNKGEGVLYYYWDFESSNGTCVGVECWDGEMDKEAEIRVKNGDYEACLSYPINETSIDVLVIGG